MGTAWDGVEQDVLLGSGKGGGKGSEVAPPLPRGLRSWASASAAGPAQLLRGHGNPGL